jgi:hypothetical protein
MSVDNLKLESSLLHLSVTCLCNNKVVLYCDNTLLAGSLFFNEKL